MIVPSLGEKLNNEISRLANTKIDSKKEYYFLSLYTDDKGKYHYQMTSHWVGFTEDSPRREIREASLVQPKNVKKYFKSINEPVFVINEKDDLKLFLFLIGGHGLVEGDLAKRYIHNMLQPQVFSFVFDGGFVAVGSLPKSNLNRFADPKLRMEILNRDNRRCKICGARPSTNEHVQLHLHHIIPFGSGGITDESNLITICQTCHKGLQNSVDYSLFESIGVQMFSKKKNSKSYIHRIEMNVLVYYTVFFFKKI